MQRSLQKMDRWRYQEVARLCTGDSVLDVGCGFQALKDCLPPAAEYVGVDLDGGMVRGSAENIPIRDRSFDTVVLCEVLEHLNAPGHALRDAARIARRRIVVTVPNDHSLVRMARLALNRPVEIDPEHLVTLNPTNIAHMLRPHGFDVVRSFAFPLRIQLLPEIRLSSRFGYWHFIVAEPHA